MADVNVNNSLEAVYVRSLKWDFDGNSFTCSKVPDSIKEKLKVIFNSWKIGHHTYKPADATGNVVSVSVTQKQFLRVKFTLDKPKMEVT